MTYQKLLEELQKQKLEKTELDDTLYILLDEPGLTEENLQTIIGLTKNIEIFQKVAKHPNFTEQTGEQIFQKIPNDCTFLIKNPQTNPQTITKILEQFNNSGFHPVVKFELVGMLAANPNKTLQHIQMFGEQQYDPYSRLNPSDFLASKHVSAKTLQEQYRKLTLKRLTHIEKDESISALSSIAKNPNCPPKILQKLYKVHPKDQDPYTIQKIVLNHPNCPPELLTNQINKSLTENTEEDLLLYAISASKTPSQMLQKIWDWIKQNKNHPTTYYRTEALLNNPHLSLNILDEAWDFIISTSSSAELVELAAKNPNLEMTTKKIQQITNITEPFVEHHVIALIIENNKNLDKTILQQLLEISPQKPSTLIRAQGIDLGTKLTQKTLTEATLSGNQKIRLCIQTSKYTAKTPDDLVNIIINLTELLNQPEAWNTPVSALQASLNTLIYSNIEKQPQLIQNLTSAQHITLQKILKEHNITLPIILQQNRTPVTTLTKKPKFETKIEIKHS